MDSFTGKWKTVGLPENLEEYANAVGLNDKLKGLYHKPHTCDFSWSGDVVTIVTIIDGIDGSQTRVVKLGELMTMNVVPFGQYEARLTLNGDELISDQDFGSFKQTLKMRVEKDGLLYFRTTANGATMVRKLEKV